MQGIGRWRKNNEAISRNRKSNLSHSEVWKSKTRKTWGRPWGADTFLRRWLLHCAWPSLFEYRSPEEENLFTTWARQHGFCSDQVTRWFLSEGFRYTSLIPVSPGCPRSLLYKLNAQVFFITVWSRRVLSAHVNSLASWTETNLLDWRSWISAMTSKMTWEKEGCMTSWACTILASEPIAEAIRALILKFLSSRGFLHTVP